MWLQFSKKVADGSERKFAVTESKFLPRCQNPQFCKFCPSAGNLLGSAFPKPCSCALTGEKGGHTMRKKYNTPHRSRVVKTRLSEDEYADFTARLAPYGISQSEFLRQAIRRATMTAPVVHVSSVNDELLIRCREADSRVRQDRRQPQSDCPVSERIRRTLQHPFRRGTRRHIRPCRPQV